MSTGKDQRQIRGPVPARRYYVATLGCKLNQFDSAHAEGLLRDGSYQPTDDPGAADVILLNTCTVTMKADADGRRLARRLRRLNPGARIVATGCYAEREPEALERLGVLDQVVPLSSRAELPRALLGRDSCSTASIDLFFGDRSRAFVRVQEGCDLSCSYCVIPSVRGPSRSVPIAEIETALIRLEERGVREVGLTGVNTGAWGADLSPPGDLHGLLESLIGLIDRRGLRLRLRLNSLEPRTVTPSVLGLMRSRPELLAPHIQIPLQSGSDSVLGRMSRNYRTRHYRAIVELAAETVPGICLGADVITGFPGETEEDHEATEGFIESLPLAYLHVFTYSPRPGTRAAARTDPVPERLAQRRTTRLRALGASLRQRFQRSQLGSEQQALALDARCEEGGVRCLTGNYIELSVKGVEPGEVFRARVGAAIGDGPRMRGEVLR